LPVHGIAFSSEMICEAAIDRIKEVIVLTASANKFGAVNLSSTQSQLQFRSKATDGQNPSLKELTHHTGQLSHGFT
jgi:hypothetical protein